ncbi:hypothetical protein [Sphingomonas quercus]|uniref:PEP-CTERM protein-sorting domain-containing protein n=1 Tax=Sphingomonas quercus TaxID=2842451 RepID=A0ABS6BG47_9SPHN|nr:hypothetical protein [Sphingomonas quercus]MBU3077266.1 hypothetical protein [Sphingomonas quercus]
MSRRFRPFAMLASGFTTIGMLVISPDALPPAAAAGLLLLAVGLLVGGMRRSDKGDSVSA